MTAISHLGTLLATMEPQLNPGVFVFASIATLADVEPDSVVAMIRESEGLSVVMTEADALRQEIAHDFRSAWITLNVNSALEPLRSLQSASN